MKNISRILLGALVMTPLFAGNVLVTEAHCGSSIQEAESPECVAQMNAFMENMRSGERHVEPPGYFAGQPVKYYDDDEEPDHDNPFYQAWLQSHSDNAPSEEFSETPDIAVPIISEESFASVQLPCPNHGASFWARMLNPELDQC